VGGVDLDHVEAGGVGPGGGAPEVPHDRLDAGDGQLLRRRPPAVGDRRRGHRDPSPAGEGDGAASLPGTGGRPLPPGVTELDPGGGPLVLHETDDPLVILRLLIGPQSGVPRADASFRADGGRLGHHQPRASPGESAEVHEVPVGRAPVRRGVLAHRRHPRPVAECRPTKRQRREEDAHPEEDIPGGRRIPGSGTAASRAAIRPAATGTSRLHAVTRRPPAPGRWPGHPWPVDGAAAGSPAAPPSATNGAPRTTGTTN
jgi:hypothetical protein